MSPCNLSVFVPAGSLRSLTAYALKNASRSALTSSFCVVHMPRGACIFPDCHTRQPFYPAISFPVQDGSSADEATPACGCLDQRSGHFLFENRLRCSQCLRRCKPWTSYPEGRLRRVFD